MQLHPDLKPDCFSLTTPSKTSFDLLTTTLFQNFFSVLTISFYLHNYFDQQDLLLPGLGQLLPSASHLVVSLTPTAVCIFVHAPQPFSFLTDSLLRLLLWSWLNTDSALPYKLTSLFLQSVIKSFIYKDVHHANAVFDSSCLTYNQFLPTHSTQAIAINRCFLEVFSTYRSSLTREI